MVMVAMLATAVVILVGVPGSGTKAAAAESAASNFPCNPDNWDKKREATGVWDPSGANIVDVGQRVGENCFREVFRMDDSPTVRRVDYRVQYRDNLYQEGSGKKLDVAGKYTLVVEIYASGKKLPYASGEYIIYPYREPGYAVVSLKYAGTFEGQSSFGIGLKQKKPFKVYETPRGTIVVMISR